MVFNSIDFLIFFPIVVAVYFVVPKKARYIWLLISSYYFYMGWNPKYAALIAASTLITYFSSLLISFYESKGRVTAKKICLWGSLIANLGILCVFKYANFALENISKIASLAGFGVIERRLDILLPVGISFYTFQALSYTLDVYRGETKTERNILKYALYVSFFPQLVAGPIERSGNLLPQIQGLDKIHVWNLDRIRDGCMLMMWGFFLKLVIADRAALLVDTVVNNYRDYGFVEILLAIGLFAIQIYCDFGGYTCIARGAAKVMGFDLMNNFRQPYLAVSIQDFWRRWHISLTSWFTDYLYIPLGGNRKGTLRKYLNILIVFAVSGLWHGASWNFIAWGLIHAMLQIAGDLKDRLKNQLTNRLGIRNDASLSTRIRRIIGTFILVCFAWVFFVADNLDHALHIIEQMFVRIQTTSVFELGLDRGNWFFLLFGVAILLTVDILHENNISIFALVNKQETWFRWALYLGLIWTVIMFGIYGVAYDASTFIYFQF